ncbi:MAG: hypothetical protein WBC44_09475 [Planctomycetaceae bacterium]
MRLLLDGTASDVLLLDGTSARVLLLEPAATPSTTRSTLYGPRTTTTLYGTDTRTRAITGNAARSTIYGR